MFYQGLIAELRIRFHLNPDGRSHTEESLQRGMAFPLRLQVICQSRSLLQYCIAHLMIFCSMFKIEGLQCQLLHYSRQHTYALQQAEKVHVCGAVDDDCEHRLQGYLKT